ncbi:hypothetical protein [Paenibacillus thiaminolyticus]|uniref:Uncharacterized protein n=1 Tax=Paenibacillus thiaminolyticus TaxID=49283 RepID=A0A3A3GZK3_PANTH|nr:hypothetical protein [Paenibacillus thiaminolyticus]RJG21836.1 hypothetical protein DQX05_19645 [Paenibacillus thiaminolyticus]
MSWEELLELSSHFKGVNLGENKVAGFYERHGEPDQPLLKIVNGLDMAKANSRKTMETLPTRIHLVEEIDGKSMEAFYLLRLREILDQQ